MTPYLDKKGKSGIAAYAVEPDSIVIKFKNGSRHRYQAGKIGADNLAMMVRLAEEGLNLNTFINQHPEVKNNSVPA